MRSYFILALFLLNTLAAFAQSSTVSFNLNDGTGREIAPVTVKTGNILPAEAKSYPVREGYRFGGWYTTPECRPEQEWRFGNNASFFVQATDSMKVEKSMTLYANYVGTPSFQNVVTPVFGEIAGGGEPAPLTSFWGPSMSYKIENCVYKNQ